MKTTTTITAGMTGSQFITALNNNSSIDDLGITVGSSDITTKLFDYVCDGTADEVQINLAIEAAAALTNGGCVFLSAGKFTISSRIIMKSNVRLILTPQTTIFLANASNDYMLVNDEFETGTTDFSVIGGRWDGNGAKQTKVFTGGNPANTFFGFGFLFKNGTRIIIRDIYMEDSSSWGMAHFLCTDIIFKDIVFNQNVKGTVANTDGITGVGVVNLTIDNVKGYTGDDFIAIAALSTFFGSLQNTKIVWGEGRDCENITIKNIECKRNNTDSLNTYAGIGIYSAEGMKVKNIQIENISGKVKGLALIHCVNYWPDDGKGYIENLNIYNVQFDATNSPQPIVSFSEFDILEIDNLDISTIKYNNYYDHAQEIFSLSSAVSKANITNVSAKNYVGINKHLLCRVDTSKQAVTINMSAIDITSDLISEIRNGGVSESFRINAPDCYVDVLSQVNNSVIGDRLLEKTTFHPMLYTTKWIDVIDGSDI